MRKLVILATLVLAASAHAEVIKECPPDHACIYHDNVADIPVSPKNHEQHPLCSDMDYYHIQMVFRQECWLESMTFKRECINTKGCKTPNLEGADVGQ
jgi:hypothetical protein